MTAKKIENEEQMTEEMLHCRSAGSQNSVNIELGKIELYDNFGGNDTNCINFEQILNKQSEPTLVEIKGTSCSNNSGLTEVNQMKYSKLRHLPKKFFPYSHVPPPLVCTTWLKLVYRKLRKKARKRQKQGNTIADDGECSGDDSLPLASLRTKLKQNENDMKKDNSTGSIHSDSINPEGFRHRPKRKVAKKEGHTDNYLHNSTDSLSHEVSSETDSSGSELKLAGRGQTNKKSKTVKTCNILIVNRKRGRPRKSTQLTNTSQNADPNSFIVDEALDQKNQNDSMVDDWWSNNDDDDSSDPIPVETELEVEEAQNGSFTANYQEHDYFKPVEEKEKLKSTGSGKGETAKKKKKRKDGNPEVQGIKVGKSKLVFPCVECGKSFSAASTLKYHMRIHNGTLIKCKECDKGFTTNYLLKCHMRLHSGDLFMCHKCGRGFTTAELLKVHSRGHTGDRPFTCHVCGKTFSSASNLAQHKETHDPEKKYLCFQCGSSFSQKRCLDGHMLSHGEKNHICNVCGKLWARKSDLTEHMRVHTGSKPYSCNMCPQRFTQASSLKRHQIVHTETKPIPCSTCGKLFKCEEYFKRHVRKHEKESELTLSNDKDE